MKFKKLHKNINFNSALIKAKVMNALGSTPNKINDFMLIADNDIFGTIGGGTLEFQVINESKKLLINYKKENILKIRVINFFELKFILIENKIKFAKIRI